MRATIINGTNRTNRRFSVLGACGLLAITVIQVPTVADLWEQWRSQHAARNALATGLSDTDRSARLEELVSTAQGELSDFEHAMVGVELMPTIQSELMDLARASGCQLRKAVVQAGSSEIWETEKNTQSGEELEVNLEDPAAIRLGDDESPYRLRTEQLSLSLTGTLSQTLDFLDRVRRRSWLMRVAQINLTRDAEGGDQLNVEANLAFYKLIQNENVAIESMPRSEGSRASRIH